jgi:hypothetical protein
MWLLPEELTAVTESDFEEMLSDLKAEVANLERRAPQIPPKMGRVRHLGWGWSMKPSRFTEEQIIGILRE